MKFKLKDSNKFGWEGLKGFAYNSKGDFENASAAYFELDGRHGKIKNQKSDRTYFVIDGSGEFIINNKIVKVEKMDVIIVPKNTLYDYKGKMKLFLVDSPAYDKDSEVKIK
jgi:mannose-6-phosphate isomerase-like protein (cupin superfamily)